MNTTWILAMALACPAARAADTVWVVDDDGGAGVDFTSIQPAVDAAQAGDFILVKDGAYDSFIIDGKSLNVVGDPAGTVTISVTGGPTCIVVRGLASNQPVLLEGLLVQPTGDPQSGVVVPPALLIDDCQGLVFLQDCIVEGNFLQADGGSNPGPACHVLDSYSATFVRCIIASRQGPLSTAPYPTRAGLVATDSYVYMFDSTFRGGDSPAGACSTVCLPGTPASHGTLVAGSCMFASGCIFQGGRGGGVGSLSCTFPETPGEGGHGGDGLKLVDGAFGPGVQELACTFLPGTGGHAGCGANGTDGLPVNITTGWVQNLSGRSYPLEVSSPVRSGDPGQIQFQADPGNGLFLLIATAQRSPQWMPSSNGYLHVAWTGLPPPSFFGVTPASGIKAVSFTAPPIPGGTDATGVYVQVYVFNALGQLILGTPQAVVLLDSAFSDN